MLLLKRLKKERSIFFKSHLIWDGLEITLRNALDKSSLQGNQNTKKENLKKNEMVGESEAIRQVKEMIEKVAADRCACIDYRSEWFR